MLNLVPVIRAMIYSVLDSAKTIAVHMSISNQVKTNSMDTGAAIGNMRMISTTLQDMRDR